jgi:hypothetical protein
MTPAIVESPYRWDAEGLDVSASADYGGATGYLASAYLADLTFEIDFTPVAISMGSAHVVGHIGGPDYDFGPGITVEIDAANGDPYIMARIVGNDNSNTVLNSGVVAWPYARYSVVLERSGLEVTLKVNGAERARATQGSVLTGLDEWSLGAQQTMTQTSRFSFQGFIHSFAVVGSELNAIHDPGK